MLFDKTARALACAALAGMTGTVTATAEDLAILLANTGYATQPALPDSRAIAAALRGAGFAPVLLDDLPLDRALLRLEALRPRIAAADSLVIVLDGHVVRARTDHWLLAPEAGRVSALGVGTAGLPLGPLLDLAAAHPGSALVAVVDPARRAVTGPGLAPGFEPRDIPQGVTVLAGPAAALADLFDGALFDPGIPVATAVADAGRLRAEGYLPANRAFLPPDSDAAGAAGAEPALGPEDRLRQAEEALRLSRDERRKTQQSLAILGFDPRGIDGVFGPATRAAIRAWQGANAHAATGYLDARLLEALFQQAETRAAELEAEAARRQAEEEARDSAYWRDTGRAETEAGARAYLDRYPDGLFADIASARLKEFGRERLERIPVQEREAWTTATKRDTAEAYRAYLDSYPDGAFAETAEQRLAKRQAAEAEAGQRRDLAAVEDALAGNAVMRRLVEARLADLGLKPGAVDGRFDATARKAIRRFQQARGLTPTGYLDQATMVRLLIGG